MLWIGMTSFGATFCFYLFFIFKKKEKEKEVSQIFKGIYSVDLQKGEGLLKQVSSLFRRSFSFLFPKNENLFYLQEMIRHAGIKRFTAEDIVTIRILAMISGFFLMNIICLFTWKGLMLGVLLGLLGHLQVNMKIRRMIRVREEQIDREILMFVEAVYSCVKCKLALPNAMKEVAQRTNGTLSGIFRDMIQRMEGGYTFQDSMQEVTSESNSKALNMYIDFILQTHEYGTEIGPILENQLERIREDIESQGITKAQIKGANINLPNILFIAIPTIGIFLLPMVLNGGIFNL